MAIKGLSTEVIGLSLLGVSNSFAIWSAANPSVFTVSQFTTEQSKENARLGMNIGLGLNTVLSAGLYFAYGKKGILPAALTAASGVGLYVLYEYLLGRSHITNPNQETMAQQAEAMQGSLGPFQITTFPGEESVDGVGGAGGGPGGGAGGSPGPHGAGGRGGVGGDEWVRSHLGFGVGGEGGSSRACIGGICASSRGGAGSSGSNDGGEGSSSITGMPQGSLGGFQPSQFGYGDYGYIYPPPQSCIDHPNDPCIMSAYYDDYYAHSDTPSNRSLAPWDQGDRVITYPNETSPKPGHFPVPYEPAP